MVLFTVELTSGLGVVRLARGELPRLFERGWLLCIGLFILLSSESRVLMLNLNTIISLVRGRLVYTKSHPNSKRKRVVGGTVGML